MKHSGALSHYIIDTRAQNSCLIHSLCVYTWTQLLGCLSSTALRKQSQISPRRQGSTKDGAGGSSGPLASVQRAEKKVNQVLLSLWEKPGLRSPTPLLPMAQAGPQESAPITSKAQRFHLHLIWHKRKEEFLISSQLTCTELGGGPPRGPPRAGGPFSHYKILRFCPNWATKLKRWRRENIFHFSKAEGDNLCSYSVTKNQESSELPVPLLHYSPWGVLCLLNNYFICAQHTRAEGRIQLKLWKRQPHVFPFLAEEDSEISKDARQTVPSAVLGRLCWASVWEGERRGDCSLKWTLLPFLLSNDRKKM